MGEKRGHRPDDALAASATDEYPILRPGRVEPGAAADDDAPTAECPALGPAASAPDGLVHLETEIQRLHDKWRQIDAELEQREARIEALEAEARDREAELLAAAAAEKNALRARIAELEHHIDGRRGHWAELEARLAERDATIRDLEAIVAAREEQAAREQSRTEGLAARVAELERQAAELAAHGKTREQQQASLEAELAEAKRAREDLAESGRRIEALERERAALLERNEALGSELDARGERVAELEAELRKQREAVDRLEQNLRRTTDLGTSLLRFEAGGDARGRKANGAARAQALPTDRDAIRAEGPGPRKLVATLDGRRVEFRLDRDEMTIGRGQTSDIRIPSHFVSRTHARLTFDGRTTFIEDAGSKNGTRVNARRIERQALENGDVIGFGGDLELVFVDAG